MSFIRPFISPVQGLLLRTLYADKIRGWSQHDLSRHLGVARETLRHELHVLERARVVIGQDVGRKKLYRPNPTCPIHGELKSMMAKSYGIVEEIGALLAPFKAGIKWAFVQDFGIDIENADVEPVARYRHPRLRRVETSLVQDDESTEPRNCYQVPRLTVFRTARRIATPCRDRRRELREDMAPRRSGGTTTPEAPAAQKK